MITAHWLFSAACPLALLYAVVSDSRHLIIPNWTCIVVAVAFLPAALLGGMAPLAITIHYGVGLGVILAGIVLFAKGIMGGGDLKLLAAASIWTGWNSLLDFLFLVAMLGGVLALVIFAAHRLRGRFGVLGRIKWIGAGDVKSQSIPYGIAIGLAALALLPGNPALPPSWPSSWLAALGF